MQTLIKSMIAIDPAERPTFDNLLHSSRGTVFPETFYSFLHNYVASVNELSNPSPFAFPYQSHPSTVPATPVSAAPSSAKTNMSTAAQPVLSTGADGQSDTLPSDSDRRMERLWSDYESVEPYLLPTAEEEAMEDTVKEPVKIEYSTPNVVGKALQASLPMTQVCWSYSRHVCRTSFL